MYCFEVAVYNIHTLINAWPKFCILTLYLLTWRLWWVPNVARNSRWVL